ncbi:AGBL2 (predicted) [Pycnogonum litorale]
MELDSLKQGYKGVVCKIPIPTDKKVYATDFTCTSSLSLKRESSASSWKSGNVKSGSLYRHDSLLSHDHKSRNYDIKQPRHRMSFGFQRVDDAECRSINDVTDYTEDPEAIRSQKRNGTCNVVPFNISEQRRLRFSASDFKIYPPRWPVEMQLCSDKIYHINTVPSDPERLHTNDFSCFHDAQLVTPFNKSKESRLIYSYHIVTSGYFQRSSVQCSKVDGGDRINLPRLDDSTLQFESRFECGNLEKVYRLSDFKYVLYVRSDLYTSKHNQWFYFRIRNTQRRVVYRFSIVNFHKSSSLYSMGMRPLFYSVKNATLNNVGWIRVGYDISYCKNENCSEDANSSGLPTYTMSFSFDFPYDDDTVYFAHCYPYTYTDLQNYLRDMHNDKFKSTICKQRVLCRSLAGNYIFVLTITSPGSFTDRKVVIITTRVHPGETNSSYVVKGLIDYVTSDCAEAKLLRDKFIFKIIPMLNPDGVIVGNTRCSLSGLDLNRMYRTVVKENFPSVWYAKQLIHSLLNEHEVLMYCDIHGHSRKHNVFMYGCDNYKYSYQRYKERVFPIMFQQTAPGYFSYDSCKFNVQRFKEGTGRVTMWKMGITNSYTLETSFCGSSMSKNSGIHFNVRDFETIGRHFCKTLLDYYWSNDHNERVRIKLIQKVSKECSSSSINLSDIKSDKESSYSSDGETDTSYESDILPAYLQKMNLKIRKKKAVRSYSDSRVLSSHRGEKSNEKAIKCVLYNSISKTPSSIQNRLSDQGSSSNCTKLMKPN